MLLITMLSVRRFQFAVFKLVAIIKIIIMPFIEFDNSTSSIENEDIMEY